MPSSRRKSEGPANEINGSGSTRRLAHITIYGIVIGDNVSWLMADMFGE